MKVRTMSCTVAAGILVLAVAGLGARTAGAAGQTPSTAAQASPAAQTQPAMPGWMMPAPHENAPLGKFERFPGDGEGAYKTGHYRDLFAEQGHAAAETHDKIENAFQQLFH